MEWKQYQSQSYFAYCKIDSASKLPVLEFTLTNELFNFYSIEAIVVTQTALKEETLSKEATISIEIKIKDETKTFSYKGNVFSFELINQTEKEQIYKIFIHSDLWKLQFDYQFNIYQNKTKLSIIETVLKKYNIPFENSCKPSEEKEETNTQFQESTFDYLIRLMQECEFIFYFDFEKQTYILTDSTDNIKSSVSLQISSKIQQTYNFEEIVKLKMKTNSTLDNVQITSYNYQQADNAIVGKSSKDNASFNSSFQHQMFISNLKDKKTADNIAKQKTKSNVAKNIEIESTSLKAYSGCFVEIKNEINKKEKYEKFFIIKNKISLTKENNQWIFRNTFTAQINYTPFVAKQKPQIFTTQTAKVIGSKENQEINVDSHGRVQVMFYWNNSPTAWIRVMQWGMAGNNFGNSNFPRVGQEVIINFINGNSDQPLVLGTVYNSSNENPLDLGNFPADFILKQLSVKTAKSLEEQAKEQAAKAAVKYAKNQAFNQINKHVNIVNLEDQAASAVGAISKEGAAAQNAIEGTEQGKNVINYANTANASSNAISNSLNNKANEQIAQSTGMPTSANASKNLTSNLNNQPNPNDLKQSSLNSIPNANNFTQNAFQDNKDINAAKNFSSASKDPNEALKTLNATNGLGTDSSQAFKNKNFANNSPFASENKEIPSTQNPNLSNFQNKNLEDKNKIEIDDNSQTEQDPQATQNNQPTNEAETEAANENLSKTKSAQEGKNSFDATDSIASKTKSSDPVQKYMDSLSSAFKKKSLFQTALSKFKSKLSPKNASIAAETFASNFQNESMATALTALNGASPNISDSNFNELLQNNNSNGNEGSNPLSKGNGSNNPFSNINPDFNADLPKNNPLSQMSPNALNNMNLNSLDDINPNALDDLANSSMPDLSDDFSQEALSKNLPNTPNLSPLANQDEFLNNLPNAETPVAKMPSFDPNISNPLEAPNFNNSLNPNFPIGSLEKEATELENLTSSLANNASLIGSDAQKSLQNFNPNNPLSNFGDILSNDAANSLLNNLEQAAPLGLLTNLANELESIDPLSTLKSAAENMAPLLKEATSVLDDLAQNAANQNLKDLQNLENELKQKASSIRFNEISMNNTAFLEEIKLRSQKNLTFIAFNNRNSTIVRDDNQKIYGNRYETFDTDFDIGSLDSDTSVSANLKNAIEMDLSIPGQMDIYKMTSGMKSIFIEKGKLSHVVGAGDISFSSAAGVTSILTSIYKVSTTGSYSKSVAGDCKSTVKGENSLSVAGNNSTTVKGNDTTEVSGKSQTKIKGEYSFDCVGQAKMHATKMDIKSDAQLTLETSGAMTIKANALNIEALSLTIKGTSVKVSADAVLQISSNAVVQIKGALIQLG